MGSKDLRKREIWQDASGPKAGAAERNFFEIFLEEFKDSDFEVRPHPKEFNNIYFDVKLNKDVLAAIYKPNLKKWRHGLVPDYAIDNKKTGKTLYVEVKRQDGWVEGKPRSAGRGNAHERSCKFFTPGLIQKLRKHGKIAEPALPFWVVFQGDITRDPCRVREITFWYNGFPEHFFMWRDLKNKKALVDHFNKNLKHLLL
jgi:hypothetical protein